MSLVHMRIFGDDILASTLLLVSSTSSDLWVAVHLFVCEYVVNREIYKDHKNRVQAFHRIYQRQSVFNFGSDGDGFISRASGRPRWQINWQIFSRMDIASINWVKLTTAPAWQIDTYFESLYLRRRRFYLPSNLWEKLDLIIFRESTCMTCM